MKTKMKAILKENKNPYPKDPFDTLGSYESPKDFNALKEWESKRQATARRNVQKYLMELYLKGETSEMIEETFKSKFSLEDNYFHNRWFSEGYSRELEEAKIFFEELLPLYQKLTDPSQSS